MKKLIFLCLASFIPTLSAEPHILALAGSTRKESTNKKLVREAARMAEEQGAVVTVIDIKDYTCALYDEDLETEEGMPLPARRLRQLMIESDMIFIASPNYNGSVSAVLKNALDWASRSEERTASNEAFKHKTFVLMSASPGKTGGAKGLGHLRSIIEHIGGTVCPKEVSVGRGHLAFDENDCLIEGPYRQQLQELISESLAPVPKQPEIYCKV